MPKLSNTLIISTNIALAAIVTYILVTPVNSSSEIIAHTVPSNEYTLQHAAIDMERIYQGLQQNTEELKKVANDFTVLVDRLEDKKAQQAVALATTNN